MGNGHNSFLALWIWRGRTLQGVGAVLQFIEFLEFVITNSFLGNENYEY